MTEEGLNSCKKYFNSLTATSVYTLSWKGIASSKVTLVVAFKTNQLSGWDPPPMATLNFLGLPWGIRKNKRIKAYEVEESLYNRLFISHYKSVVCV